jgi:hypothetical protein
MDDSMDNFDESDAFSPVAVPVSVCSFVLTRSQGVQYLILRMAG